MSIVDDIQGALIATFEDGTVEVKDMTDNGGFGLVRWARQHAYRGGHTEDGTGTRFEEEHIVHRWASEYTDGSPVQTATGFMFYSGGYWDADEDAARQDYRGRDERQPTTTPAT